MAQSKTNETTTLILDFFLENGIYARRHGVASGSAEYTNRSGDTKKRYIHAGITGGLDIFVWLPKAPFLAIDVKTGHDRLREAQVTFISYMERMGHLAMTVKDYPDFLRQIYPLMEKYNVRIKQT